MQPEIKGQHYPGKRYRYDGRNIPDPRGPKIWDRQATRPIASMPSVISSGSPTGVQKSMHPALMRNPAKSSRKMSIADAGTGGHGAVPIHWPTKSTIIGGVMEKLPDLVGFAVERARFTRDSLRAIFRGGR